jgi:tetratricopeptide (TPR) repeat protein
MTAKLWKFFKYTGAIILILVFLMICGIAILWNEPVDISRILYSNDQNKHQKAIERNPEDSDAWMEYSVSFNKAGDFHTGFKYLNKAVELSPAKHLGYRGWIKLRKLRDFNGALQDFERLDTLTPNFVDAPWGEDIDFLRGECHFGNKNYEKALECFRTSLSNRKEGWSDVQTFVYLGLCEKKLGNYKAAILELERALHQYGKTCEAHVNLAEIYLELGDIDKAKEHLAAAEDSFPYRRNDVYNEFLNEIYWEDVSGLKQKLFEISLR